MGDQLYRLPVVIDSEQRVQWARAARVAARWNDTRSRSVVLSRMRRDGTRSVRDP